MTYGVLKILYQNLNQRVSGEHIARTLNISRAAVKKHIDKLTGSGYAIDAVKKSGYSLSYLDDVFDINSVKLFMEEVGAAASITFLEETASTNDTAKNTCQNSAFGAVISARQTGGKGRRGRVFTSPEGGVYLSFYHKPIKNITPYDAVKTVVTAAVAAADTFSDFGIEPGIKWANDIFFRDKKLCGILCEMVCESERAAFVVQGVGINVNTAFKGTALEDIACSMNEAAGKKFRRAEVCAHLIKNIILRNAQLYSGKYAEVLEVYRSKCITIGKHVEVVSDSTYPAFATGIDDEGFLLVKAGGETKRVIYGDVSVKI